MHVRTTARPKSRKRWLALILLHSSMLLPGLRALADGEPSGVKVQMLVRAGKACNGTPLPSYPGGEPEVTVLRITIPPDADVLVLGLMPDDKAIYPSLAECRSRKRRIG